jgi:isopenicillin-N N-acyltransferase-like protein
MRDRDLLEPMSVLPLRGSPFEIGRQHGEALKESIEATVQVYMDLFAGLGGVSQEEVRARATRFGEQIEQFDPRYMDEIKGISAGSGRDLRDILAVNARTEILTSLLAQTHECTAFCFAREGILAQTWDWIKRLEGKPVLLKIHHDDGHTILTMTEPGIVGKIGLNSAGVGVGLNILSSSEIAEGVPIHVLLRSALDSKTWDDAFKRITTSKIGTNSAITLADDKGRSVTCEYKGHHVKIIRPTDDVLVHTNHYLDSPALSPVPSSEPRLIRASSLIAKLPKRSLEAAKRILSDRQEGDGTICMPWHDDGDAWGAMGTLCSVVMDLKQRALHISRGHPADYDTSIKDIRHADLIYDVHRL